MRVGEEAQKQADLECRGLTAMCSFLCSRRTRCSMISTALRMFLRICCILSRLSSLFSRRRRVCGRCTFSRALRASAV